MSIAASINSDPNCTWVYGKETPGWYCARWTWGAQWAKELEEKGYKVQWSIKNPDYEA